MNAPDKIFVPTRFRLVDGLRVRESDTDEEYIRKDTLLDWLKKEYEIISWYYEKMKHITGCVGDTSSSGKVEAYKRVIEKIESL